MTVGPVLPTAPKAPLAPPVAVDLVPLASWPRRVAAVVVDQLALGGLAFLAAPVQPASAPAVLPALPTGAGVAAWTTAGVLGTVALLLLQAYLGSTPGKLLLGIAVVGDRDGRPVGLVRTVGRWFAHLLDAVALLGYLRPLWHAERRTFADSLLRTVVLSTRQPRPHALLARTTPDGDGPPRAWTAPVQPRWRRVLTWAVGIPTALLAASALVPTTTTSSVDFRTCDVAQVSSRGLQQATVRVQDGTTTVRRLGIERAWDDGTSTAPGVVAHWSFEGQQPASAEVRLELSDGAGTTRAFDFTVVDGDVVGPEGIAPGEMLTEVRLDPAVLDGFGEDWGWRAAATVDGVEVGSCGEPAG